MITKMRYLFLVSDSSETNFLDCHAHTEISLTILSRQRLIQALLCRYRKSGITAKTHTITETIPWACFTIEYLHLIADKAWSRFNASQRRTAGGLQTWIWDPCSIQARRWVSTIKSSCLHVRFVCLYATSDYLVIALKKHQARSTALNHDTRLYRASKKWPYLHTFFLWVTSTMSGLWRKSLV